MVSSSSCRYGAGVKTIRQSSNCSRVRNPAPLGCVTCFFFVFLIFFYIFLNGSWCPLFFFLTGSWCPLFFVILVFSFLFFNNTPMEVVPPVGMFVCTAAYTLAADGAVLNTPKKY